MLHEHSWGPQAPATPRLAVTLRHLGNEVDELWPDRGRASDGWIGDAAHQGRQSDHNPDSTGLVHAVDLDLSSWPWWAALGAILLHPSTNYVIVKHVIFSRSHGFAPAPYNGPDPHTSHLHVSCRHDTRSERSMVSWLAQMR